MSNDLFPSNFNPDAWIPPWEDASGVPAMPPSAVPVSPPQAAAAAPRLPQVTAAPAPVQALDALRLPLQGSRLIEASAGTGKTYTIAQLYLRLVLGHGPNGTGFARALTPPEILVVTFTDAATNELRDRIRQRLGEAAAAFEAGDDTASHTPSDDLLALRADFDASDWPGCAKLLRVAADWMDEAAVSTIHSWCYRMLREHAFDSGNLFTQTLLTDEEDLLLQATQDYWRHCFYGLSAGEAKVLSQVVANPEALAQAVKPLLAQDAAQWQFGDQPLDPGESPITLLTRISAHARNAERLQATARQAWAADADRLERLFRQWLPDLDGRRYPHKDQQLDSWLADLRRWSAGNDAPLGQGRKHIKYFGYGQIKFTSGKLPPPHAAFVAIDAWLDVEEGDDAQLDKRKLRAQLITHATWHIRDALAQEKMRRAELGFDDVLRRLHAALTAPHGAVLAQRMRRQFPVAMIDEFQDTDPIQWAMFDRVYDVSGQFEPAVTADTAERALLLIGDPKQAIYGFRGADIHTYLQARRATEGRHYSLGTNYRSTQALVGAVNAVFAHAETTWPEAAFRFAHAFMNGQQGNPMPFIPVEAKGRDEKLVLGGKVASALTWWWLAPDDGGDAVGTSLYRQHMAQACATQMAAWLQAVAGGGTGFLQPSGQITPLRPRDMAVLVRDRKEADAIRQALAARGIASAYLSERESVFESAEAQDLSVWLEAVHSDAQGNRLRAALGTASMGRSHAWLERLNHDEALWDDMVLRFRGYHALWRAQGVLPMVRQLLHDFALPSAWLSLPNGARTLTNMLHLAEWLQTQAQQLDSPQALMRELARQIDRPGQAQDGARLRLESDDDLIKVVTIHKSKGLEYPLVMLPFIASWKSGMRRTSLILPAEDESGARRVNLDAKDADDLALEQLEREREDLRLLYVALTRARHGVWLGVAPLAVGRTRECQMHLSALGYLVGGNAPRSAPAFKLQVQQLCERWPAAMRFEAAPAIAAVRWQPTQQAHDIVTRAAPHRLWQPWWIASYSAITGNLLDEDGASLVGTEAAPLQAPTAGTAPDSALDVTAPAAHGAHPMQPEPESSASEDAYELTLAQHMETELRAAQTLQAQDSGDWDALARDAARLAAPPQGVHAFARGAEVGTFWHELLQLAAMQGLARVNEAPDKLGELVARRARVRGWGAQAPAITGWLLGWLRAPLPLPGAVQIPGSPSSERLTLPLSAAMPSPLADESLGAHFTQEYSTAPQNNQAVASSTAKNHIRLIDLAPTQLQPEMEFWLPVHDAAVQRIDALVRAHIEPGWARPQLAPMQLRGMLKGYMDLVFQAPGADDSGRYFVLDYKSNWLGNDDASYHPDALRAAALASRYDLQAALYGLALHRLLRTRLPHYQPERHLGGSLTWFLRGTARPDGSVWSCPLPVALLTQLDALFDAAPAGAPRSPA